jgi:hypothetical protein
MNQEIVDTKYPFGVSRMNKRYPNPGAVPRVRVPLRALDFFLTGPPNCDKNTEI